MALKPQDVVVLLKLSQYQGKRPPIAELASELFMSASEVHAAIKRSQAAHLLHGPEMGEKLNFKALEEFLLHGLKYVFSPECGGMTRGIPTSYAAEPLCRYIQAGDEPPPVWPSPEGHVRGVAFEPLYSSVPKAAKRDEHLYQLLALADAIRSGRSRERKLAEKELIARLHSSGNGQSKS